MLLAHFSYVFTACAAFLCSSSQVLLLVLLPELSNNLEFGCKLGGTETDGAGQRLLYLFFPSKICARRIPHSHPKPTILEQHLYLFEGNPLTPHPPEIRQMTRLDLKQPFPIHTCTLNKARQPWWVLFFLCYLRNKQELYCHLYTRKKNTDIKNNQA